MVRTKMKEQSPSWPFSKRRFILDLHIDYFESQDPRNETAHSYLQQLTVFTPRLTKGVPEDHNIKTLMKVRENVTIQASSTSNPPSLPPFRFEVRYESIHELAVGAGGVLSSSRNCTIAHEPIT